MFDLGESGGLLIDQYWDDAPSDSRVDDTVNLSTLAGGQQFVYIFDLGDNWAHLSHPRPYWSGCCPIPSRAAARPV